MSSSRVNVTLNPTGNPPLAAAYVPAPSPPSGTEYWVCLRSNGSDITGREERFVPTGGALSAAMVPVPGSGTFTIGAYLSRIGGALQFESAPFVVPVGEPVPTPATRFISGIPTSGVAGSALVGTDAGSTITFRADFIATPYAALVTPAAVDGQPVGSALIGAAVALPKGSGTAPALTPPSAGMVHLAMLDGPTGNVLVKGGPITVAAAAGTPPPVESGSLSGVPSSGTAGTALAGPISFTATNVSTPFVALVTTAAVLGQSASGKIVGSAVALSGASGTIPALTPSAAGTVRLALLNGAAGTILALSGDITVAAAPMVESGALSGVPSSATAGSALVGTGAGGTIGFTTSNVATPYAALVTTAAVLGQTASGKIVGSAVALSGTFGAVPALTPPSVGTVRLGLLNGSAGTLLALSGNITIAAAPLVESASLSGVPSSATAGSALSGTITFTATNIATPYAAMVTSAATVGQAVGGALIGSAVALSGTSGTVPALTPPSAGTVHLALLNGSTGTVRARSGAITVAAAATPPVTQSGGGVTLNNVPASIVAGQPLTGVTFSGEQGRFVLYNLTAGAEEGPRLLSNNLPVDNLGLFTPQANALYTIRAYNFESTTLLFESSQISVTAAPGALPAQPTQASDTNRTQTSVTLNWTATGTSYRVLARTGPGTRYGSALDTTGSSNSYDFTGLPVGDGRQAHVVPQNANGYGTTSAGFFSYTTA